MGGWRSRATVPESAACGGEALPAVALLYPLNQEEASLSRLPLLCFSCRASPLLSSGPQGGYSLWGTRAQ